MKKVLLSFISAILFISAQAQVCTPDTTITTGMFPPGATTWDSLLIMPTANVAMSYSEVLQIKAPKDTTITSPIPATLAIDSITFLSITGLPNSITYNCDNASCLWPGGGHGCATFSGTPQAGEEGVYMATINAYGWVNGGPLGTLEDSIKFYMKFTVDPAISVEESSIENSFKISPNPVRNIAMVSFNASDVEEYRFKIIDVTGRKVYEKVGETKNGVNAFSFDRNNLPDGVYIYLIESNNTQKTGRIIFSD